MGWSRADGCSAVPTALAKAVPKGRNFAEVLRWSGFMMPHSNPDDAVPWIQAFLEHDFQWYFTLGVAAAKHQPVDVSGFRCQ